ncbi:MAG: hypothetical protein SH850_25110 [Planctomycetaceae bacterium]|nr:hypothetical protein [Planctomycetaceae bacterium]
MRTIPTTDDAVKVIHVAQPYQTPPQRASSQLIQENREGAKDAKKEKT